MPNPPTLQFFDAQGNPLTREQLMALPVGTTIYTQRGDGPKIRATKLQ